MRKLFLSLLFFLALQQQTHGQSLDPYRRINDPMGVSELGGIDGSSIMRNLEIGDTNVRDSDGYSIFASDTGAGILRHLWITYVDGYIPAASKMRLWIDDSLMLDDFVSNCFLKSHGLIHSPFDTASSGAEVFECQIPYRHNFRWTHKGDWCWHEAEYQRIDSELLPSPSELGRYQTYADSNYWKKDLLLLGSRVNFPSSLATNDTTVIAELNGPAIIQDIHFHFPISDTAALSQLWIQINWDYCPSPSISLPLADLFGVPNGVHNIHAWRISVDSTNGNFDLTFPMPFKSHASISIINNTSNPVSLDGFALYRDTVWNDEWGYLATQLHISRDIEYHVLHPILHVKGDGRYIGVILNYSDSKASEPVFMEGDGYLRVDSLPYYRGSPSVHYSGTEDYCDGGWYFDTSQVRPPVPWPSFTLPFRGSPNWPVSMYRFHINAPFNYSQAMDIDWGHGFFDDYTTSIRSTAFYYTRWTPFYPSCDTLIAGNVWKINGAGFPFDTTIVITLDSDTIYLGSTDSDGAFFATLLVLPQWKVGNHLLFVNSTVKPEWITILPTPKVVYLADTLETVYSERDSINIRGYGFKAKESLMILLGDTLFEYSPHIITDTNGNFSVKLFLPWVPEGHYYLSVRRSDGSIAQSDSSLFVTRTLDYEFESLSSSGPSYGEPTFGYYGTNQWHLSQGAFDFCYGNWTPGSTYKFEFSVPFTDTFVPTLFALKGDRYAIYSISIDGIDLGFHDWFLNQGPPLRDSELLSPVYLTAGTHTMTCVNIGHDDSTREYSFGPDNFTLRPLSSTTRVDNVPSVGQTDTLSIFPNPLDRSILSVSGIPDSIGPVQADFCNEIGQTMYQKTLTGTGIRSVDTSPLPNGSYWLILNLPNGVKSLHVNVLR